MADINAAFSIENHSLPLLSELEDLEISENLNYTENETGILKESFSSKKPYKSEYSFTFRITYAIHCFKNKKCLTSEENTLFQLYLSHGDVDISTKPIANVVKIDPRSEKEVNVKVMVHNDYKSVDFLYTLHTFIVNIFSKNNRYTQKSYYEKVGSLIKSFLVYLEENTVCPEYANDINESIQLCDQVAIELPMTKELSIKLPDKTNRSFSLLYGGTWSDITYKDAGALLDKEASLVKVIGFDLNTAKSVTGYEARGQLNVQKKLDLNMYITFIDKEARKLSLKEKCEGYKPLEFTIEVDKETIKYCMKYFILDGIFIKLSDGTWYLDQLFYVSPPFYYINTPI
ncbi:hypothetical protein CONCODRAFT_7579 [Conidiobolus coronatus NRRL 28638]|uniref:Uncharacterized protein n=1 Tax=Conidiobolus coronatus (strain ATCC 28846 / CBS 209.66 / NRRL 28638) TaxID=796925 RepID=A0A137P4I8_CONC2|nr:hypothetical protein CONCODRAFT_7579 [Conidiobolus coronatus NRRL 28638]|eukprot:KXN69932.1 hypothetical protein CONCODRAFT_7579 [Conidiobolus coronatus NRRL 28638]